MEYVIKHIESEQPLAIAFNKVISKITTLWIMTRPFLIITTYFVLLRAMLRLFFLLISKKLDISYQVKQLAKIATPNNLNITFPQHKAIQMLINDFFVFDGRGFHYSLFFESSFFENTHGGKIKIKYRSIKTF